MQLECGGRGIKPFARTLAPTNLPHESYNSFLVFTLVGFFLVRQDLERYHIRILLKNKIWSLKKVLEKWLQFSV